MKKLSANTLSLQQLYSFGLFILVVCMLYSCTHKSSEITTKPNVVFIFTDDQTYTSVHALGNEEIFTPNIDRLVRSGTTFTNAYNMGAWNGAVCAASRAMLNSGRSVWRANEFRQGWSDGDSIAYQQSWAKLMEGQGYNTYMTGKWHVDAPAASLFQVAKDVRPGMPRDYWNHADMMRKFAEEVDGINVKPEDIMPIGYNRPLDENDDSWSPTDLQHGGFWQGGTHWTEVVRHNAIEFIDDATAKSDPFFMYLAFNAPHDPRQAPQEYIDMYPLEDLSVPESFLPVHPDKEAIGNGPSLRDEALAPYPRTPYAIKVHKQEYYASITYLDHQVGLILDHLEAQGVMDNTYIIFTADHGLAMGRHGLLGKQTQYDHSIRVPMIMTGPDIPADERRDADVYIQDVMATALELAGLLKPKYVEFHSFLDIAQGKYQQSHHDHIYGAYIDYQRMIRKDGKKLIVYPKLQKVLLYDLTGDPEEITNLSDDPSHKATIISLLSELMQDQILLDDQLDLSPTLAAFKNSLP